MKLRYMLPILMLTASAAVIAGSVNNKDRGIFLLASEFTEYLNSKQSDVAKPEMAIKEGSKFDLEKYRSARSDCAVNSMHKTYGRSEIIIRWRCGKHKLKIESDDIVFEGNKIVEVVMNSPVVVYNGK